MSKDPFTNCHPVVNFTYFAAVLGCSMFILHPAVIIISLISAILYSISLVGLRRVLKFNLFFSLPGLLIIIAINPLFNHFGVTQLILLQNGNSITLEAILYGLILGLVLVVATNWFTTINQVLTRDKFIDVIGRILPTIALLLAMTFRFIPLFINQFKKVLEINKSMNQGISDFKGFRRLKQVLIITSAMFGWALENAVHTSDAMQLRSYGEHKRSLYQPHHFDPRNWLILGTIIILTTFVILGKIFGYLSAVYNPIIQISNLSLSKNGLITTTIITGFAILANIPLILKGYEILLHNQQRKRSLLLQKDES